MEQDGQVLGPQGFRALTVRAKVSNVDCEGLSHSLQFVGSPVSVPGSEAGGKNRRMSPCRLKRLSGAPEPGGGQGDQRSTPD